MVIVLKFSVQGAHLQKQTASPLMFAMLVYLSSLPRVFISNSCFGIERTKYLATYPPGSTYRLVAACGKRTAVEVAGRVLGLKRAHTGLRKCVIVHHARDDAEYITAR